MNFLILEREKEKLIGEFILKNSYIKQLIIIKIGYLFLQSNFLLKSINSFIIKSSNFLEQAKLRNKKTNHKCY